MSKAIQEALRALNKRSIRESVRDKKGNIIDSEWLEYRIEGLQFVKDIIEHKISDEDCRMYYYDENQYNFNDSKPKDSIELLIYKALRDRLGLNESTKRDDIDADRDDKVERARKIFRKRRDDADSDRDYRLKRAGLKEESAASELRKDQEWVDYDMEHDHHISKATQKDIEDQGLQIEKDQYGDYEVAAGHYDESLNEDIASSIPAQPLPRDELYAAIEAVKPGSYVHAGYLNDVTKSMVASKYTGGRKATAEDPVVVIYKATEIYGRCGIEYENIQSIKDRRAAGIERQGNKYEIESELENKIYRVPSTGSELLQIYPRSRGDVKVRYFISVDGEDLRVAEKEEIALYSRASSLAPHSGDFDPGKPMRLNLSKIYWFKNLGHSIM